MRVLVTGGAGYIGSVMCNMLEDSGYEVMIADDLSSGHPEAVEGIELSQVSLLDLTAISDALSRFAPDAVMHFAGLILAGESVEQPLKYFKVNLEGSLNLARAMLEVGCKSLVYSSSAAVYGIPQGSPITEDATTRPINPYGLSKLMFENVLDWLERAYGLKYMSLRYFNTAGADLEHDLGEDHHPETHLIPKVIFAAMGKSESIEIYGTDYPTPDGTCVRDFIHVVDLCRAHLLALKALGEGEGSGAFNLGNGNGFSVREVVEMVKKVTGKDFPVVPKGRRHGDPPVLVASSRRAREVLSWQPVVTEIEEIIDSACKWHSEHPEGYAP